MAVAKPHNKENLAMEEKRAALLRFKVRLASIENKLEKKLAMWINVLRTKDRTKFLVAPPLPMNFSFDETPSFQSTSRRASEVGEKSDSLTSSIMSQRLKLEEIVASLASQSKERAQSTASKLYVIMDEMRKLPEVYETYAKASADLLDRLKDKEVSDRATIKAKHYTELVENIINELRERIWKLCQYFQSPLPS